MTETIAPIEAPALDTVTDAKLAAVERMARLYAAHDARKAENAAAREASGLKVGDEVTVMGGGHSGETGKITGVGFAGGWEVTIAQMPRTFPPRLLALAKVAGADIRA